MAVKTPFSKQDFERILARYDLGSYLGSEAVQHGTVQTNYFLQTTQSKFVFRYYENREPESVLFEIQLLNHLLARDYPCPEPFRGTDGKVIGMYDGKPYTIMAFIDGQHVTHPSAQHRQQLVQKAAELQLLTRDFRSQYQPYRWNYDPSLCLTLAQTQAKMIDTQQVYEKTAWLEAQLATLQLPPSLPKGICHCDFHFSNVLFQDDRFVALLDFDDANYTYLQFDLVGLLEAWAWPDDAAQLDLAEAQRIVGAYMQHRPLSPVEQQHLYDVYRLSILFDCVWYLPRGSVDDCRERSKIDALTNLGRERFTAGLFPSRRMATVAPGAQSE